MTKIRKGKDGRPEFVWVVEIGVSKTWVEDGFLLNDDRMTEVMQEYIGYSYENEVSAKVLEAPDPEMIAKAQGYKSALEAGLE